MAVKVNMARRSNDKIITASPFFHSGIQHFNITTNILETYENMKQKTIESFATYTSGGSGWIFQSIENLFLKVDRFNPLKEKVILTYPQPLNLTKQL